MVSALLEAPPVQAADEEDVKEAGPLPELLEKGIAVVMLRMQGVPGNRKIPGAAIKVDDHLIDEGVMSSPTLRLVPPDWQKKFNQVHGKAERLVRKASPPKPEEGEALLPAGCHLIAAARKASIAKEIEDISSQELSPLASEFAAAFPGILEERRQKLDNDTAWQRVKGRIPPPDRLRKDIKLRFVVLPFTFLNEAGRELAEEVAGQIIGGLAEAIAEEADKLREKVSDEKTLKEGSFSNIKNQLQLLQDFSFLASPETLKQLQEVKVLAAVNGGLAQAFNSKSATAQKLAAGFRSALGGLAKEVTKDAKPVGGYRRAIRF